MGDEVRVNWRGVAQGSLIDKGGHVCVVSPRRGPRPRVFAGWPSLRVLSLGAGVQSSTLFYMILEGLFESRPCAAVFADTGWEPSAVYRHLEYLEGLGVAAGVPVHRVSAGDIRADALASKRGSRFASMPLFSVDGVGRRGPLRRQCTREYKINPIKRKVRDLLGVGSRGVVARDVWVEMWIGISVDEIGRVKRVDPGTPWVRNVHPLIDLGMSRDDCVRWAAERGYPAAPKSSCIGCPYHDDAFWLRMKEDSPEEFAAACKFDDEIRVGLKGVVGQVFLHRSCVPLRQCEFRSAAVAPVFGLFGEECLGICGV